MHSIHRIRYISHKLVVFVTKVSRSFLRRGVLETFKRAYEYCGYHTWLHLTRFGKGRPRLRSGFDSAFGTQTDGKKNLLGLGISSPNVIYGILYQPTPPDMFLEMMRRLAIDYQEYVFVDFGAGKGRALMLAAQFPFRKVIGVEFSRRLVEVARKNIAMFQRQQGKYVDIEILLMDAADFQIPPDKAVLYFYNPFEEPVMLHVLRGIENSFRAFPRELFLLYFNPVLTHLFENLSCFKLVERSNEWGIYRSVS